MITVARFERMRRNLTTANVIERAQVDGGRYRLWECGQAFRRLKPDELARVSEVFGLPVEMFADGRGFARVLA